MSRLWSRFIVFEDRFFKLVFWDPASPFPGQLFLVLAGKLRNFYERLYIEGEGKIYRYHIVCNDVHSSSYFMIKCFLHNILNQPLYGC